MKAITLAGSDWHEEGAIRVVPAKISVWVGAKFEEVDFDSFMVQTLAFVDVDEDYEKLAWVGVCPLCDVNEVNRVVYSQLPQSHKALANSEKRRVSAFASGVAA